MLDAPSHHVLFINRPADYGPTKSSCVAQESYPERPDKHFLKQIEGDVWNRKELTGVGEGEADMSNGERRQVGRAQSDVFGL